jgi:hypothetical protein
MTVTALTTDIDAGRPHSVCKHLPTGQPLRPAVQRIARVQGNSATLPLHARVSTIGSPTFEDDRDILGF